VEDNRFAGPVRFSRVDVEGAFDLLRNEFATNASTLSTNASLRLEGVSVQRQWRIVGNRIGPGSQLENVEFGTIGLAGAGWNGILDLLEQAQFSPELYDKLDRFLQRQGRKADAAEVYHRAKQRALSAQREELPPGLWAAWRARAEGWLLPVSNALWRHGRDPLRLLATAILINFVCFPFFSRSLMTYAVEPGGQAQGRPDSPRRYSALAFCWGAFVPVLDFPVNEHWEVAEVWGRRRVEILADLKRRWWRAFHWAALLVSFPLRVMSFGSFWAYWIVRLAGFFVLAGIGLASAELFR